MVTQKKGKRIIYKTGIYPSSGFWKQAIDFLIGMNFISQKKQRSEKSYAVGLLKSMIKITRLHSFNYHYFSTINFLIITAASFFINCTT